MKLNLIASSLLMAASVSAGAAQDKCLDQNLVNEIQQHINLQTSDLKEFDRCNPDTNTYKIFEALSVVRTIQFESNSLGQPFSQNILPNDFWGYFSARASLIQDEESCPKNVLAFVYGFAKDSTVHVCKELYDDRITVFERAETMLHEVRHFEGYTHVTCTRGPRNGDQGACDESVDEKGSYAVTVESLTKMALKAKGLARTQRAMLSVLALTYANETFNKPIEARDLAAFYLVGADNKGYIYSDKGLVEVANLGDVKVISRNSALAVFPNDKSDAYTADTFSQSLDPSPAMGAFSMEYNSTPVAQRPTVVDIMNLDYLSGSITSTQMKTTLKADGDGVSTVVNLPWTATAVYSGKEVGRDDSDSLYVVNSKGEMYRVQFSVKHQYNITPVENNLRSFLAVSVYNNNRMALDQSGAVQTEVNGTWSPFTALKGKSFVKMSRPFLWDQYFEDNQSIVAM